MHKGTHQAIVDDKLWERANRIMTAKLPGHNFVPKAKEYIYLLAGLLKCGDCGSHMMCNFAGGREKRKFFYYECNRAKQSLGCSNKRISATVFDQAVIDYFKRASNDQEIITRAIGNAILESQLKLETLITKTRDTEEYLNTLRHESQKLLDLAMEGTIPQGSTFKDKMTALETKIEQVTSELSRLQAQKRIAQMNAHSGEFLHHNIRFAMEYLDKAPAEAQKSLLRALIKDIVIYEDKIAVNMFISEPIQDILPSTLPEIIVQKVKRPTETCEALTENRPVSDSCQNWLPREGSNLGPSG
ncbi:MAG: hypothetical protein GX606_05550 [Elusimicrobia bacterium]|nr:hypothetical protein [Elusimicrobiota bacterium]